MNKPSKTEVNELIDSLFKAHDRIGEIATAIAAKNASVRSCYSKLQASYLEKSLSTVPVEDLNLSNNGINIQALKSAGKNYLSDLSGMNLAELKAINGIGEVMADKIYQTLEASKEGIKSGFRLRISEEDFADSNVVILLSDVYFIMNRGDLLEKASALNTVARGNLQQDADEARKINQMFSFFSKKKDKENRMAAYERLLAIKDSGYIDKVNEVDAKYKELVSTASTETALLSFKQNTAPFFAAIEKLCGVTAVKDEAEIFGLSRELVNKINAFNLDTSNMIATLRSYQEFGTKYILNQQRVLLGDEMGLGKTMQAIASMAHLVSKGRTHFIVVCPVSVMVNWGREIEKHSKLKTIRIHGDHRNDQFENFIANGGIAITTFETIVRLPLEKLTKLDMLTVDEAHYVKNPSAQRTVALKTIAGVSDYILLMTGTPLENKVEEMIFLISMLRENLSNELKSMITLNKAPQFREKVAPVYLRRIREDVLTELPEKLESEEWCDLTKPEKDLYIKALTQRSQMGCRRISYEVENISDSSKITRLLELCDEAKAEGRKIVVFSFFLSVLDRVQEALGDRCFGRITGAIPSEERQDIIDRFADTPDGTVMLSQIIAGGVGLNIQCASVVIICEPQWKPSTENQAISRCYRMGQSKSVLVYRLLSDNTVDEEIMKILKAKSQVFDEYADESEIDVVNKSMMDNIIEQQRQLYGITDEADSAEMSKTDDNLHSVNTENADLNV